MTTTNPTTWSSWTKPTRTAIRSHRRALAAVIALGAALASAPLYAQAPATSLPATPQDEAIKADITVQAARVRLASAEQEFDRVQQQYRAGAVTGSELSAARARLDQAQSDLRLAQAAELPARRRDAFFRPVDVTLHEATLPQAADVLGKFAGFPVSIATDVPADIRVSLQARGVPFGTVLEAVAREAKLMISPDRTGGVLLRPWPTMVVNGDKTQRYVGPNAPWSDEWGTPSSLPFPGMDQLPRWQLLPGIVGQAGSDVAQTGAASAPADDAASPRGAGQDYVAQNSPVATSPYSSQYVPPAYGYVASGPRPGGLPVALSQLAPNMVVLAEPGVGSRGEPGIWLTVYLYDQREGRLVRRGSTFHAFQPPAQRPAAGAPSYVPVAPSGANPFGAPKEAAPGSLSVPPQPSPNARPGARPADPTRQKPAGDTTGPQPVPATVGAGSAPVGVGSAPEQPKPAPGDKPASAPTAR